MAWTAPRTWVVGEIVTAALMNTHVRDNTRYVKGLDGVVTIESGLTIDNTDGDERLLLPLLSTAECNTVLNAEGEVAFDEQTHTPKYYNGSAVKDIGDHGSLGGLTDDDHTQYQKENVLTTAGDIAYATAASTWARLGIGTANQLLRTNTGETAPEWTTVGIPPTIVRKTSDETVNNSSALQNDDELLLALGANEVWEFKIVLNLIGPAAADFKFDFTVPASATGFCTTAAWDTAGNMANYRAAFGTAINVQTSANAEILVIQGLCINAANAGNLQFQWAQSSATVGDTIVYTNSCLIAHKLA